MTEVGHIPCWKLGRSRRKLEEVGRKLDGRLLTMPWDAVWAEAGGRLRKLVEELHLLSHPVVTGLLKQIVRGPRVRATILSELGRVRRFGYGGSSVPSNLCLLVGVKFVLVLGISERSRR